MRGVVLLILVVFFSACSRESCRESIDPVSVNLKVERLEKDLFSTNSPEEIVSFLDANQAFASYFLDGRPSSSKDAVAQQIHQLVSNPSIDTLYNESVKSFEKAKNVISEIESGYGRLKAFYPQTQIPKVQTVVTGLAEGGDLLITNEHLIIGLDFFIGAEASFKPINIPNYILRRYNMQHLPSIVLQFVSSQYVAPGKGEAMLTEMIDFGKAYYLLSKVLPCTPERILIGYTEEEWNDVFQNDEIIWANFVQKEWLYETNHSIKQKFLGERPNVYEIGDKCPGRIGAWLGWQIVNAYMKNTDTSLQQLMSETDHNKIFGASGYKPN